PPQQPYGAPPQQPYGAPAPPPAVPVATEEVKVPVVAWLVPLAALLALIGVFTPWFKAKATATGNGRTIHHTFDGLYSFKDGKIGLLAPILLVVIAIGVIGLILGRTPARLNSAAHPVASAGKASIIAGGVSLVCVIIAWFLVKSQYKFTEGGRKYGWDEYIKAFKDAGAKLELSRGPQIGYFLTIAAGVLAIVAGILMILAARSSSATPAPSAYPPAGANFGPAPGAYPPAPAGYGQPPAGQPQSGPPAPQGPPPPRY
ncbi:MAG: hypothetical protein ABI808_06635, partial [Pseudonocardiales bacterium]